MGGALSRPAASGVGCGLSCTLFRLVDQWVGFGLAPQQALAYKTQEWGDHPFRYDSPKKQHNSRYTCQTIHMSVYETAHESRLFLH